MKLHKEIENNKKGKNEAKYKWILTGHNNTITMYKHDNVQKNSMSIF